MNKSRKIRINLSRISRLTGYSVSHLSRVIRREHNPSMECLTSIAKAMKVDLGLLYTALREGRLAAWKNN